LKLLVWLQSLVEAGKRLSRSQHSRKTADSLISKIALKPAPKTPLESPFPAFIFLLGKARKSDCPAPSRVFSTLRSFNQFIVLNLQQLEARGIVAKASSQHHADILQRLYVNQIVFAERDAGVRLAEQLHSPNLIWWRPINEKLYVAGVVVSQTRAGKSLNQWLGMRRPSLRILNHLTPQGEPLPLDLDVPLPWSALIIVAGPLEDVLTLGQ
jgi:hypothetical protein